jgi:hypothetical protein
MCTADEIAYGLVSILLITPLLGLLVAQLPLNPRPLAFGLGVVCTVPTALACGVAFVQVGAWCDTAATDRRQYCWFGRLELGNGSSCRGLSAVYHAAQTFKCPPSAGTCHAGAQTQN